MIIHLARELETDSIVDGEGIRAVIWMQGCLHHCQDCHNPETHDFNGGFTKDIVDLKAEMSKLSLIDGITLSGGDPMFQPKACLELLRHAKKLGLNTWLYTGFTFEQLWQLAKDNTLYLELLNNIDVMIDGKFDITRKSLTLPFRGSTNQRIINVKKSLREHKVIQIQKYKKASKIKSPKYPNIYT